MTRGEIIKQVRKHRGLTQIELAEKANTSNVHINRIEKNKIKSGKGLESLCKALDFPLAAVYILSLNDHDICPTKRGIYNSLKPKLQGIIEEIFDIKLKLE